MTSLKQPAATITASLGKPKKQRITKVTKKQQQCSKHTSDLMDDINTVGSQSTDSDAIIVHSDTIIDDTEGSKSTTNLTCADTINYNDSFSADAIQACNNLRAVIVELTSIINQQKVRITSIEHQLTNSVSTLQNISDVQQIQNNMLVGCFNNSGLIPPVVDDTRSQLIAANGDQSTEDNRRQQLNNG